MTAIAAFLTDLPKTWKAVTALAGAMSFGALMSLTMVGFMGLPDQVAANFDVIAEHTDAIERNTQAIRQLAKGDSVIICILTLPETTRPIDAQRECQ